MSGIKNVDTSDEACALVCMIVSNPGGGMQRPGWEKRVNDLIRALRDERNAANEKIDRAERQFAADTATITRIGDERRKAEEERDAERVRRANEPSPLPESHVMTEVTNQAQRYPGSALHKEIEQAINRHSGENGSNTPDYILAQFLTNCLIAFDTATLGRDRHHTGRKDAPKAPQQSLAAALDAVDLSKPPPGPPNPLFNDRRVG